MKKKILILAAVICTVFLVNGLYAQKPTNPVSKGNVILGFGIGPATQYAGNGWGFGPGFKFWVDAGAWKVGPGTITMGGEYDVSYFGKTAYDDYHWNVVNMMFAVRGAYHYGFDVPGLDLYAGIPLGFGFAMYHYDAYQENATDVFPYGGIFFGASYYFNDVVGINGEVGFNATYADLGLVFRLK